METISFVLDGQTLVMNVAGFVYNGDGAIVYVYSTVNDEGDWRYYEPPTTNNPTGLPVEPPTSFITSDELDYAFFRLRNACGIVTVEPPRPAGFKVEVNNDLWIHGQGGARPVKPRAGRRPGNDTWAGVSVDQLPF